MGYIFFYLGLRGSEGVIESRMEGGVFSFRVLCFGLYFVGKDLKGVAFEGVLSVAF